uniref:SFRICE_016396 n=1 Tax=Spodoptera frugiperda TaxID=7108 RepID=A0A2H1VVG1_SPOFR
MMKLIVVLAALVAISAAKPALVEAPLVAAAPAPVVTATSSQYYHRVNNGLAAYVASPAAYVASPGAYVASPAAYVASPAAYVASAAAPYVASPYVASPYAASAPLVAV